MANKKPVPLKDEPIYLTDEILQHIERLTAAVNNLSNERQIIIKDIEELSRKNADTVSTEFREVIMIFLGNIYWTSKKLRQTTMTLYPC